MDFQNGLPRARCALAMTGYKKYGGRADVGIGPYEAARDAVQARFRVVREAGPYAPFTDRTP